MKVPIYQLLHVASMVLLTAIIFQAFANPDPARRKKTLMVTGILSLIMLIGGFGLLAVLKIGFPVWILVKIVCWIGLSAMAGLAFRMPNKIPALKGVTIALVLVGIIMVYFRHTTGQGLE